MRICVPRGNTNVWITPPRQSILYIQPRSYKLPFTVILTADSSQRSRECVVSSSVTIISLVCYNSVTTQHCHNTTLTKQHKCHNTTRTAQHKSVTTQECHNTTVSQNNSVTTQQYHNTSVTKQHCHNTTVSQHNTVTTQQCYNTTVSQHKCHNTTVSQLNICEFSGETFKGFEVLQISMRQRRHNCSPAASFANWRYDNIPVNL